MNAPTEPRNCPYCLNPVAPDEDKVRCPKCGVTHHADCWKTNGKCSVYGCDGWAAWSESISDRIAPAAQDAVIVDEQPRRRGLEVTRCIKCGAETKPDEMLCGACGRSSNKYWFDYCLGGSVLVLGGFVGCVVIIARAILT